MGSRMGRHPTSTRGHLPALEALHEEGVFVDQAAFEVKGMLVKYIRNQQETTEKNLKKKDVVILNWCRNFLKTGLRHTLVRQLTHWKQTTMAILT